VTWISELTARIGDVSRLDATPLTSDQLARTVEDV
jgi:hypothetical protein